MEIITKEQFELAFNTPWKDPSIQVLKEKFNWAKVQTSNNIACCMAAINEVLMIPIKYSQFKQL